MMSFRRKKEDVQEQRSWRDFRQANASLFEASGVPFSLYEAQELFEDLLMHGYIDHHPDPTHFFVGRLSSSQREALIDVVVCYLRAGFPDPGIGGFMGNIIHQDILRRASGGDAAGDVN